MPIVNAPPGMRQARMYDGTVYKADRATGHMNVDNEAHARAINQMSGNGDAGLLNGAFRVFGGSKTGRVCPCSLTIWNAWTTECPKCGEPTQPE